MDRQYDLIIIGGRPAGLSAAISAHKSGLRYVMLEKEDHVADTAYCYQKGKLFIAEPSAIPLKGELWLEPSPREAVLQPWEETVRNHSLNILLGHCVEEIDRVDINFQVKVAAKTFQAVKSS